MSLKWPPPIYSHYNIEMISTADNEPRLHRLFLPLTSPSLTGWRLDKRLKLAWMHWSFQSVPLEKTDYPRHGITAPSYSPSTALNAPQNADRIEEFVALRVGTLMKNSPMQYKTVLDVLVFGSELTCISSFCYCPPGVRRMSEKAQHK